MLKLLLGSCVLLTALSALVLAWQRRDGRNDPLVRTFSYAPGLKADVLFLDTDIAPTAPRPAALLIHGGGWRFGNRKELRTLAVLLAKQGIAPVLIDYRLTRDGHSWPAQAADVSQAVWWIREHAGELRIDPKRIAAIGSSAGAYLAAWLATTNSVNERGVSSRVNLLVSLWGLWDLAVPPSTLRADMHELVAELVGEADPRAASPLWRVDQFTAATLIIHGTRDEIVPPDQSRRACVAIRAAGAPCTVVWLEGEGHVVRDPVNIRLYERKIVEFLEARFGPQVSNEVHKKPRE